MTLRTKGLEFLSCVKMCLFERCLLEGLAGEMARRSKAVDHKHLKVGG